MGVLVGRTVVVTRAADQAGPLVSRLQATGAEVIELAVIAIAGPADGGAALRHAVGALHSYDWVVLSSPNAAARFLDTVAAADEGRIGATRIAAVGPGTAEVVEGRGHVVALVPGRSIGEGLVDAFGSPPAGVGRVLLPRAASATDVIPAGLRARGWSVDVVEAYRTVAAQPDRAALDASAGADAIVFTSSSTVTNYLAARARSGSALPPIVVSIGPATTATLDAAAIAVTATADPHTLDGLVDAVLRALS